jgi:hypothetical protein
LKKIALNLLQAEQEFLQYSKDVQITLLPKVSWNLLESLFQLTLDWNYSIQALSSVFFLRYPIVMTAKPISNHWHASVKIMTIITGLGSFLPHQPSLFSRVKGSLRSYVDTATSIGFPIAFQENKTKDQVFVEFAQTLRSSNNEERIKLIQHLWIRVYLLGGVLFSCSEILLGRRVGHLLYLIASNQYEPSIQRQQQTFLIADPEISFWKQLDFNQLIETICDPHLHFDLIDVS